MRSCKARRTWRAIVNRYSTQSTGAMTWHRARIAHADGCLHRRGACACDRTTEQAPETGTCRNRRGASEGCRGRDVCLRRRDAFAHDRTMRAPGAGTCRRRTADSGCRGRDDGCCSRTAASGGSRTRDRLKRTRAKDVCNTQQLCEPSSLPAQGLGATRRQGCTGGAPACPTPSTAVLSHNQSRRRVRSVLTNTACRSIL